MKIQEAIEDFAAQLAANGRASHTADQYRRHLAVFAKWLLPEDDLERVDHQTIARFLSSDAARLRKRGKPRKASTVNALRSSVRGFFAYCTMAGHIPRDPSRLVRRARCGAPVPRTLSEEDQRRLLASLQGYGRDNVLFTLMLKTGIRVGSAVALDVEDVDLDRGELWLRAAKGNRPERTFIPRDVRELIREYLDGRRTGPVFHGKPGERLTTRHVGRLLATWLERASIERRVSPHGLRHSFAVGLLERTGGDLLLVQQALHHRSLMSTATYTRVAPERLRAALEA